MPGELAQGLLELVLNSLPRELALPALVSLSVVADAECQSHDGVTDPSSANDDRSKVAQGALRLDFHLA